MTCNKNGIPYDPEKPAITSGIRLGTIAIRAEIRDIEMGRMSKNDNPLKNAPHTALDLTDENWAHPYPRMLGCYPTGSTRDKYWCPANRVDNVSGDRHLVCIRLPLVNGIEAAN